jgi:hypothetical protein
MFRKALLAAAVVVATSLAMTPDNAEARRYYRGYRAPARYSVGYGPRYYAPQRYYAPRFYSSRYYGPSYGRGYYRGYGGGGVNIGPGGVFIGW